MQSPADAVREALRQARRGRVEQARATLERLASRGDADAAQALAQLLAQSGALVQAEFWARRAAASGPPSGDRCNTLGFILLQRGLLAEAAEVLRRAVALDPGSVTAWCNLGAVLRARRDYAGAMHAFAQGRAAAPDSPLPYALGDLLVEMGRVEEGLNVLREGWSRFPETPTLARGMCSALNYVSDDPDQIAAAHRALGALVSRRIPAPARVVCCDPDPDRPLRIGYLSADLRAHSVAWFARALFEPADRGAFRVHAYYASPHVDEFTRWFRARAEVWRPVHGLSDAAVADLIRRDGVDILVDLGGLSGGSRVAVLAWRAAPVQVTYLGYPATTGLAAVDVRFVDSETDPPGAQAWSAEQLVRLDPCFLCYTPDADAPEPAREPGGGLVFASFNQVQKISPATLGLWSRVLAGVPGSRLVLKAHALGHPDVADHLRARLAAAGIDPARVELHGPVPEQREHLAWYRRVDVALDTTPYCGTTTTLEALWMGVPVITLRGRTHAARVGASLLSAAGLSELIADTPQQYVQQAVAVAGDVSGRARWRETLRGQLARSPVCDTGAFVRRLGQAYRSLWQQACARAAGTG